MSEATLDHMLKTQLRNLGYWFINPSEERSFIQNNIRRVTSEDGALEFRLHINKQPDVLLFSIEKA